MAAPVAFESVTEKEKLREIRRKERNRILKEAKAEHDRKARKKECAQQQGEGTWMLQTVDERVKHEEEALKDALTSKRRKKHKKDKTKREKKKHSTSESEDDDKLVWQEKTSLSSLTTHSTSSDDKAATIIGPKLERDSWMTDEVNIFLSAAEPGQKRNAKAEALQAEADALEKVRSSRELNPYWKDGGTGLPSEHTDHNPPPPPPASSTAVQTNDGGLSWWRKAYRRCTELAAEENRSLEEVAAERYGSLATLKAKLEEAELQSQRNDRNSQLKSYTGRFQRPGESRDGNMKSDGNLAGYQAAARHSSASWRKKDSHFVRPTNPEARDKEDYRDRVRRQEERKADIKPQKKVSVSSDTSPICAGKAPESSSSEDNDSDSSDTESSSHNKTQNTARTEQPPARILSDQELNQLGAKILRAEMMGDQSLADQLKVQLEAARNAKTAQETNKSAATSVTTQGNEVVVLSRTDRHGMSRPLPSRKHAIEPKHGRRKREKVATHCSSGVRERYFDDDDSFSLKAMVEREKLGTAEDQNRMFARLASRSVGQTDEDFQMDDALIDRAARKQSQSHIESRERQLAIIEHKKMSSVLDKCPYCFTNIPKHLIVAIGMKVCLIVPSHQSMNGGHCLIVPMQHVTQATVVDEDVWDEIKIFRKGLTRMFSDGGEDCVFMETCVNLKRYPHMVIECIPLPKEIGDMAPVYFKKAIQECEKEWADNKKLVDLRQKDIRKSVPKGFAYFSVDFGAEGGFAHVIEDEKSFPLYFGREVVGGMLDLEPRLWRKPHKEQFEEQRRKVLHVAELWKPYDWTKRLRGENE